MLERVFQERPCIAEGNNNNSDTPYTPFCSPPAAAARSTKVGPKRKSSVFVCVL